MKLPRPKKLKLVKINRNLARKCREALEEEKEYLRTGKLPKKKFNKYGNRKTVIDNITFHSRKEADKYCDLKLLQKVGMISSLELQKPFILQVAFTDSQGNKIRPITYIADFYYYDKKKRVWIVEDSKGMRTALYLLKKKMFLYSYQDILFIES